MPLNNNAATTEKKQTKKKTNEQSGDFSLVILPIFNEKNVKNVSKKIHHL